MDEYEVDDSQGRTVRVRLPGTMLPTLANLQRAYELQSGTSMFGSRRAGAAPPPRLAFQQTPTVVRLRKKIGLNMPSGRALPPAPPLQRTRERVLKNNGALQRLIKQQQVIDKGGSAMGTLKARDAKEPPFPLPPNIFDPNTYAVKPYRLSEPTSGDLLSVGAAPLFAVTAPVAAVGYTSRLATSALLKAGVRPALARAGGLVTGIGVGGAATAGAEAVTRGLMGQEKYQRFDDARRQFREEHPLASAVVELLPGYLTGAGIDKKTALVDAGIGGGLELFNQYQDYINNPYAEYFNPNWGRVGIAAAGNATQGRPTRAMDAMATSADAMGAGIADFGRGATRASQREAQRIGAAAGRASRTGLAQSPSMDGSAFLQALFEELQSPTGGGGGGGGSVPPPTPPPSPAQGNTRRNRSSGSAAPTSSVSTKIKPEDFPRIQEGPYKGLLDVSDGKDKQRLDLTRVITDHSQIIKTLKDANDRVKQRTFNVDIPRGPQYAIPTGSVDWNLPVLDLSSFHRIVPYINPKTGNMPLKVIPRYDRQAIGTALLYAGQPLELLGGGTRYAGLDPNMRHQVVAASLGEKVPTNLLDRARRTTTLNTQDKDVAGPETPFGIFLGGDDSNLGNLEALRVSVNLLKFLVESGPLKKQDADDLIKAALYKKLGANVNARALAKSPYGEMLALTGPNITLESFLDAGRILAFPDRGDLLKTIFSKSAARKFNIPYWSSISDAMTDARNNPTWKNTYGTWARNQAMPTTGYTQVLVRVDPNKGIVNTWRDWSSARFNHYSYPWEVHGEVIGIFEKLLHGGNIEWYHSVDAPELNAQAGDPYTAKGTSGKIETGTVSSASFGSYAPPIGLIRGSVLEAIFGLPKGYLSKKGR